MTLKIGDTVVLLRGWDKSECSNINFEKELQGKYVGKEGIVHSTADSKYGVMFRSYNRDVGEFYYCPEFALQKVESKLEARVSALEQKLKHATMIYHETSGTPWQHSPSWPSGMAISGNAHYAVGILSVDISMYVNNSDASVEDVSRMILALESKKYATDDVSCSRLHASKSCGVKDVSSELQKLIDLGVTFE